MIEYVVVIGIIAGAVSALLYKKFKTGSMSSCSCGCGCGRCQSGKKEEKCSCGCQDEKHEEEACTCGCCSENKEE